MADTHTVLIMSEQEHEVLSNYRHALSGPERQPTLFSPCHNRGTETFGDLSRVMQPKRRGRDLNPGSLGPEPVVSEPDSLTL